MVFESNPKRRYKLNPLALVLVLALAYLAFGYATQTLPGPVRNALGVKTPVEQKAAEFSKNYSADLISYTDPDYGFKVSHPLGYYVGLEPDLGVRLRVLAINPGYSAEIMDVYVSNASFGEQDFKDAQAEASNQSQVQLAEKRFLNSREVYLLNTKGPSEFTDEIVFFRNAFYNCKTPEGQDYSAGISYLVPETVAADLELADYVIASFEC